MLNNSVLSQSIEKSIKKSELLSKRGPIVEAENETSSKSLIEHIQEANIPNKEENVDSEVAIDQEFQVASQNTSGDLVLQQQVSVEKQLLVSNLFKSKDSNIGSMSVKNSFRASNLQQEHEEHFEEISKFSSRADSKYNTGKKPLSKSSRSRS
jgi:hypothetical protein